MVRGTRLPAYVTGEAFASIVFDAILSVSTVIVGSALLAVGIRGVAERNTVPDVLMLLLGAGLLIAGIGSAIPQVIEARARKRLRMKQARIDAEVAAFAATLAGAEPFDITGRL